MIHHIDRLSVDVVRLQLRVIDPEPLNYQAGQYLAIHLPDGVTRCYSMARRQEVDTPLEFHIRLHDNGVFSNWIVAALDAPHTNNLNLSVSGPFGDCTWRAQQPLSPMNIMLGSGTGIAPLTALIDEGLANNPDTPIALYWGGDRPTIFTVKATSILWPKNTKISGLYRSLTRQTTFGRGVEASFRSVLPQTSQNCKM
ncbi:MAG: FAD-binding oxidoreductase [Candidatus Nitrotoga sp.]